MPLILTASLTPPPWWAHCETPMSGAPGEELT
jgi:hypothetical protein